MSWSRIKGILIQEAYIARRESAIWFDLLVLSSMSALVFGFLSQYLAQTGGELAASYIVLGMILWEILRVNQYCISVNSMWNLWSHNLTNIFVSPISLTEYVIGNCLLAFIKTSAVTVIVALMGYLAFDFNILNIGIVTLLLSAFILMVFAWAIGWLLLGFVFRYGTSVQAIAWGAIFFVQPVTAVYFPITVLPPVLQAVGWCIPSTYAFEAARRGLTGDIAWDLLIGGLVLDVLWFIIGVAGFYALFRKARTTGQFARNDT